MYIRGIEGMRRYLM